MSARRVAGDDHPACRSRWRSALRCIRAPGPAAISEIFPTRSRSTWMSAGYSLAVAVFGGFAPFIATWLIAKTATPVSPSYYVMAAAALSLSSSGGSKKLRASR